MFKFNKLLITLIAFFSFISISKAVNCSYQEQAKLNNEVANIKTNYEIKERILDKSEYSPPDGADEDYVAKTDYIVVNILNITKNTYVEVSNDYNSDVLKYNYNDTKNGNVSFDWYNINEVVKFTIKVYASSATGCEGSSLKTLYLTLPRYNDYSNYTICNSIPDYYLCQRYVTYDEISYDSFYTRVNKEVSKIEKQEEIKNKKWYEKTWDFIKDNKWYFIGGGAVLVGAAATITVVEVKKRRRSII